MVQHGARIELKLARLDPEQVAYSVAVTTADGSWSSAALLARSDGKLELGGWSGPAGPPAWLADTTRALLRSLWRARRSDVADWPKRITRWRAGPEA
jgi:hypothetical protein